MNQNELFLDKVKKLVYTYMQNEKLLQGQWHLGVVDTVVSPIQLKVFVDGSTTSQTIPCNPDFSYKTGDNVFVLFVNNNSLDKYVPFKRGVSVNDATPPSGFVPKVCQFIHSTNISVTSTGVVLPFQTEIYKDEIYSHATNDSKIYVTKTGLYKISHNVTWYGTTSANTIWSQLRKNGSTLIPGTESKTYIDWYSVREYETTGNSFICSLNANDYIEVFCKETGTAVLTTVANDTSLTIELIKYL